MEQLPPQFTQTALSARRTDGNPRIADAWAGLVVGPDFAVLVTEATIRSWLSR